MHCNSGGSSFYLARATLPLQVFLDISQVYYCLSTRQTRPCQASLWRVLPETGEVRQVRGLHSA